MDIKIEKKPWYIRHRYYLLGGTAFVIFLIYVISLSFGPRKLRIETDNIQIAEVKNDKFMEYVDVEGLVIIRKSKFPQNPKRSVRFSGKGTKRSVQKRKARNTQKAETKVL